MKYIETADAPASIGPYSQAVSVNNFLFLSGQLGLEPESLKLLDGIEAQTERALQNIQAILSAAQKTMHNVIKTTIFLRRMDDYAIVNVIYSNYFGNHRPARSCVVVADLPKNALIEIECIAY